MAEWKLTDEHINELQVATIDRLIPRCKAAHFVNVRVRINGEWEEYEADWLKHLTRIADQPCTVHTGGCDGRHEIHGPQPTADQPNERAK